MIYGRNYCNFCFWLGGGHILGSYFVNDRSEGEGSSVKVEIRNGRKKKPSVKDIGVGWLGVQTLV